MRPFDFHVSGDETGRLWASYVTPALELPGLGQRRGGHGCDGEDVLIHTLSKDGLYDDDLPRVWSAVAIARRPEVQASPFICRLIDTAETEYALHVVWEWAETSLHERIVAGTASSIDPVAVEENVRQALASLHSMQLVHCDVAPNNILLVDGVWKLGDLDSARPQGDALDRFPPNRYRHPGALPGAAADPAFDVYGLARVIERVREGGAAG